MNDIVEFPTKPIAPKTELSDTRQLWYGLEKIGKTTLAAQFPDPLFLMTEPGANFIPVRRVSIKHWKMFRQAILGLEQGQTKWGTLVIDTIDNLYAMCREYACKKLGIEHPADAEYGKGWDLLKTEFFSVIHRMATLPGGQIYISHAKVVEIRKRGGATYSRTTTTMGKAEEVVKPLVDIYAYYEYSDIGTRVLHVVGDELVAAGNRCEGRFKGVRMIPMGKSSKEAYQNFIAAFENRLDKK